MKTGLIGLTVASIGAMLCAAAMVSPATAQKTFDVSSMLNIEAADDESSDLKRMKEGTWIVVSVQRDGETVPTQFGQKPGDVITFKAQGDVTVFG